MDYLCRIYYKTNCKKSCDYAEYTRDDIFLGYPEKDEYFRKRVLAEIEKNNTEVG